MEKVYFVFYILVIVSDIKVGVTLIQKIKFPSFTIETSIHTMTDWAVISSTVAAHDNRHTSQCECVSKLLAGCVVWCSGCFTFFIYCCSISILSTNPALFIIITVLWLWLWLLLVFYWHLYGKTEDHIHSHYFVTWSDSARCFQFVSLPAWTWTTPFRLWCWHAVYCGQ